MNSSEQERKVLIEVIEGREEALRRRRVEGCVEGERGGGGGITAII